jgi:hypothetical protein
MKKILLASLLVLCLSPVVNATPLDVETLGDHTIKLLEANVQESGYFVWRYEVTSGYQPSISHWVLLVCPDLFVEASEAWEMVSPDPSTGVMGIKFNEGYEGGETRIVTIYLSATADFGDMTMGIKAGQNSYVGSILSPACAAKAIPEPGTMALLAAGIVGLASRKRHLLN